MDILEIKVKKIKDYNIIIHETEKEINFYIQKENYGIITHCVGITKDKNTNIEKLIKFNVNGWIEFYNEDIEKLEGRNMDIEKLKKAMGVLGYEYDNIDSYDGYIKFQQTGVNLEAFNSWEDVAEYLNYLVVDDEEQQKEIDNILNKN